MVDGLVEFILSFTQEFYQYNNRGILKKIYTFLSNEKKPEEF